MKYKILILIIPILMTAISIAGTCSAEIRISDTPTPENIPNIVPQPLIDLYNAVNRINIDFSQVPFINRAIGLIPTSGEGVANGLIWLTQGFGNINEWLRTHVGLNIVYLIQKAGEFFVWIFQGIVNLITAGLSFIR